MKHLQSLSDDKKLLHRTIRKTLSAQIQLAVNKNSLIINDINSKLTTETDEKIVNAVIANILDIMIRHTETNCIRLSAKEYNSEMLVYIDSNKSFDKNCSNANFEQLQLIAEKISGRITVVNYSIGPSVVFSFLNALTAA